MVAISLLTGARLLDGLFGVYNNSPLQSFGLGGGFLLTLIGWLAAAVMIIIALFKTWHTRNKVVLTILATISFMSLALLALVFFPDLNFL